MTIKYFYTLALAGLLACASGGSGAPRQSSNILTFEDLARAHADVNSAYDAIARLRPNWLTAHGVTSAQGGGATEYALVFVDGQRYGTLTSLRDIPAYHVVTMRYYDVTQAGAKFGLRGGSSGVIEVSTR